MLNVQLSIGSGVQHVLSSDTPLSIHELRKQVKGITNLSEDDFYIVHNGRLAYEEDTCFNGCITIIPRLLGGKGGFGSMLRAIGAQIEKTTNREACRDLSGRRIRDINEEKRLKAWIEKQAKREEEAAERKKKKLERLCAVPKHEFKDQSYERERSALTERVGDAVEEGFKAAVAGTSGTKRKIEEEQKPNKRKTLLDLDIDSDELDSSDDSDEDELECKNTKKEETQVSNDSGHSSDESGRISKSTSRMESEYSEVSSDNQLDDGNANNVDELKKETATAKALMDKSLECKAGCLDIIIQEKN